MTDYTGWTETEISEDEYFNLETRDGGPRKRMVLTRETGNRGVNAHRYYRLDPPATYREGEMRWLTDSRATQWSAWRTTNGWASRPGGLTLWYDSERDFILSEPVVVLPAPTDEEREYLYRNYDESPQFWSSLSNQYLQRVVTAFREQATR